MIITKLKADSDSDTPIESYATLKKKSGLIAGIDWHRLAPRKNAFYRRIRCTYAPINQPNISNCSSQQELSFELIGEKQLVEVRAGGGFTFFVLQKKIGSPFHEYAV